jgi:hypothetical protein
VSAGSHATYGGWEPRFCCVCGERVALTGKRARGAVFRAGPPPTARHPDCKKEDRR